MVAKAKKRQSTREQAKAEDKGAGYILASFDHGLGVVRLGYDNVTPEIMISSAQLIEETARQLIRDRDLQLMREEVKREFDSESSGN